MQYLGQGFQLNIRHKALPALNALNGIFIDIQPNELKLVSEATLGQLRFFRLAQRRHMDTT